MKSAHLLKTLAILSTLTASTGLLAADEVATPFSQRRAEMRAECMQQHDWNKEEMKISSPITDGWDYRMSRPEHYFGRALLKIFQLPVEGALYTRRQFEGATPAEVKLERLVRELQKYAKEENLNTWQRACLAKCASTHLLKYLHSDETTMMVLPANIVEKGLGSCKQYSFLGEYIGLSLNVPTKIVGESDEGEGGHAYLKMKIDGKYYYAEPQNDRCEFMTMN